MKKLNHLTDEQCLTIINEALKTGADYAEVFMEDTINDYTEMVSGLVSKVTTSAIHGAAVRLVKGDTVVNGSTTDISYENLLSVAKKLRGSFSGDQVVFCQHFVDNTNDNFVKIKEDRIYDDPSPMLKAASDAASAYSPEIIQVLTMLTRKNQEMFVFSSDQIKAHDHRLNTRFSIQAIASDGEKMQAMGDNLGKSQDMSMYDDFDAVAMAKDVAKSAVIMLHADEMEGGEMPVVINNGFGGVILHEACGHSLEATSVGKGMSVFCGKLGDKIASDIVNAVDSGTDENAWGSINVDDEGNISQKKMLIENGILKSYLVDRRNSPRMNHPITSSGRRESYKYIPTSRMTNTYFLNGSSTFDEIIKNTKHGLFAKRMGGGSVQPATGEFNFAVNEGYMIEDGKITKPVRGATLVGSGKDVLLRIDMIADNLKVAQGICGSSSGSVFTNVGQPTIRVSHLTVGGKGGKN